jgi:hypothetical protein
MSQLVDHDPTLASLASLPLGHAAYRDSIDAPWRIGGFAYADADGAAN